MYKKLGPVLHMARKSRKISGGYRPPVSSNTLSTSSSNTIETVAAASSASTIQAETSTSANSSSVPGPSDLASQMIRKGRARQHHLRPTHFLCIPLADRDATRDLWRLALTRFEQQVQQHLRGSDQVPQGCVRPAGTMHLTLGVMSLDQDDVQKASEFLSGAVERAWRHVNEARSNEGAKKQANEPLHIYLKSLVSMTRPTTSVLFADPIDSSGRLRPFCEALKKEFESSGLMEEEGRDLKLHATVLNTVYGNKGTRNPRDSRPKKIDPTLLLAACEDFDWVDLQIDKVSICKMGAVSVYDSAGEKIDEKYTAVKEVDMPQ